MCFLGFRLPERFRDILTAIWVLIKLNFRLPENKFNHHFSIDYLIIDRLKFFQAA
ncbi:MAG: hypothetical protein IJV35_03900 [Neisseriaceae bacterium]|nr:hypothetical protein [Neisseriaceae bacterium]